MAAGLYHVVVEGQLGPRYAAAFGGMSLEHRGGRTEITAPVADQADLQRLLARIAELGLELVSVSSERETRN